MLVCFCVFFILLIFFTVYLLVVMYILIMIEKKNSQNMLEKPFMFFGTRKVLPVGT